MSDRHETEHKGFGAPDEVREFRRGRAEILNIGVDWYGASNYTKGN